MRRHYFSTFRIVSAEQPRNEHKRESVASEGCALPDKYCETVGMLTPMALAISDLVFPEVTISSRILSLIILRSSSFPKERGILFSSVSCPFLHARFGIENALSYAEGFGRDLEQLVVGEELYRLLERKLFAGHEAERIVGRGRTGVRELFALADVYDDVVALG